MRVVAGRFRGRTLERPADRRVRVTTERVREALLDILSPVLSGARVLDLFAGSGVLGFEALSRGADSVDFVDILPASLKAIRANASTLGVEDRTSVFKRDALRFAARLEEGAYDVVLADPPFSSDQALRIIELYRKKAFAKTLVIEHRSMLTCKGDESRKYGDIALTFCHSP